MNIEIKKSIKPVKYDVAINIMEERLLDINSNKKSDLIWILEHEEIYTAGSNYKEDVEKINGSGKLQVKSNSPASVIELGVERLDVVSFFFGTLDNLKPNGLSSVNKNYQYYQSIKISDEMYLTNRTLPEYLLTRYDTKNFGTGSYSVVGYEVNVQNLIVFYLTICQLKI